MNTSWNLPVLIRDPIQKESVKSQRANCIMIDRLGSGRSHYMYSQVDGNVLSIITFVTNDSPRNSNSNLASGWDS